MHSSPFNVFFRFAAGLLLVVLVSMVGVRLEKQTLEMRRAVSVQYYQTDVLLELLVGLRLETQKLTAPAQLALMKEAEKQRAANESKAPRRTSKAIGSRNVARDRGRKTDRAEPAVSKAASEAPKSNASPKSAKSSRVATDDKRVFSPDDDDSLHPPLLRVLHPFNPQGLD